MANQMRDRRSVWPLELYKRGPHALLLHRTLFSASGEQVTKTAAANMVFSSGDVSNIKEAYDLISKIPNAGGEALARCFESFPGSKAYFHHFGHDLSASNASVSAHGKKVLDAIGTAVGHINDLENALSALSDKHATQLMVDPVNFKYLSHCILVTAAVHLGSKFSADHHRSFDKFLDEVSRVLVSKYR